MKKGKGCRNPAWEPGLEIEDRIVVLGKLGAPKTAGGPLRVWVLEDPLGLGADSLILVRVWGLLRVTCRAVDRACTLSGPPSAHLSVVRGHTGTHDRPSPVPDSELSGCHHCSGECYANCKGWWACGDEQPQPTDA